MSTLILSCKVKKMFSDMGFSDEQVKVIEGPFIKFVTATGYPPEKCAGIIQQAYNPTRLK